MASASPSLFSLGAVGVYALVVLASLAAGGAAISQRQQNWHWRAWAMVGLLFAAFAMVRAFGLEEWLRDMLRAVLRNESVYDQRRTLQGPLTAAVIAAAFGLALLWLYRLVRTVRGRRNAAVFVGYGGALAMLALLTLRLISLHQIDAVLYGPLKLNWFADLGASLVVLLAAGAYIWLVVRNPAARRERNG